MDALRASCGDTSPDSDSETSPTPISDPTQLPTHLPPPPLSLLHPPNSASVSDLLLYNNNLNRVRSFPHVEGNYALHVYIPVYFPVSSRKDIALFLKRVAASINEINVVDVDIPLSNLIKDEQKLDQHVLGREFHVSLGRTVPIRVHQRDSLVAMLRQKLQSHKRFRIEFDHWEVFVNDDCTRTFLSLEVARAGLAEMRKQIELVNGVYRLHNLPELYQDPRPHISVAWATGDISDSLKSVIGKETKRRVGAVSNNGIFACEFGGISCKIGRLFAFLCPCEVTLRSMPILWRSSPAFWVKLSTDDSFDEGQMKVSGRGLVRDTPLSALFSAFSLPLGNLEFRCRAPGDLPQHSICLSILFPSGSSLMLLLLWPFSLLIFTDPGPLVPSSPVFDF